MMVKHHFEYKLTDVLCSAINKLHPDESNNKMYYHYTSITGFLLMMKDISKNKCYIFPGNCRYQNDENELSEGKELIEEYIKFDLIHNSDPKIIKMVKDSLKNFSNDVYVSCFSSDDDLLEQWKYYGKDCGLAIGFDFDECEGFINKEGTPSSRVIDQYSADIKVQDIEKLEKDIFDFSMPEISTSHEKQYTRGGIKLLPLEAIYDDNEKRKLLKDLIENADSYMRESNFALADIFRRAYYENIIQMFIPLCKNHYFAHEKESRLVFFPEERTEIWFREKSHRILPYFQCFVVNKDEEKPPIKSITIGPGATQNLIFNSVIKILDSDNYKFYTEDNCKNAMKRKPIKKDDVFAQGKHGQLLHIKKTDDVDTIAYLTKSGILVSKSPIPFRD